MTPPTDPGAARGWSIHRLTIIAGVLFLAVLVAIVAVLLGRYGDDESPVGSGDRDAVAIAYVNAINDGDPRRTCELETPRAHGNESIDECTVSRENVRDNHYKADEPRVTQSRELHEGVGVLVQYRVTNNTDPQHQALRMMRQPDGAWLVDQVEGVSAHELGSADPILTVLGETWPER